MPLGTAFENVPYDGYDPEAKAWQNTVLHFVQCVETLADAAGDHQSTWTWVSGQPFTRANVLDRCNRMARHRWDIEEHMLVEKPLGYEYKPLYSRDWNAMQAFHHLTHIAHLLHILVRHQTTLWPMVFFLSIRGTMIKLVEPPEIPGWIKPGSLASASADTSPGWCDSASTPNSRVKGIEKNDSFARRMTTFSPGRYPMPIIAWPFGRSVPSSTVGTNETPSES